MYCMLGPCCHMLGFFIFSIIRLHPVLRERYPLGIRCPGSAATSRSVSPTTESFTRNWNLYVPGPRSIGSVEICWKLMKMFARLISVVNGMSGVRTSPIASMSVPMRRHFVEYTVPGLPPITIHTANAGGNTAGKLGTPTMLITSIKLIEPMLVGWTTTDRRVARARGPSVPDDTRDR